MKTRNFGDLDSLYFDSGAGVADWELPPHPRIWGSSSEFLGPVLACCPDTNRLKNTLLATHLLFPGATPDWGRQWLSAVAPALSGIELHCLERATWQCVHVPVALEGHARSHCVLIGTAADLSLCAGWNFHVLDQDAQNAVQLVRQLVFEHAGVNCCVVFLGATTQSPRICGSSLGLPCYLGAMAAFQSLTLPLFLATGRLDAHGNVLPVAYVEHKRSAAPENTALFLYPADCCEQIMTEQCECVPVRHVREAVDVLACYQSGRAFKIAHAQRVLRSGQGMAREMCSFHAEMAVWIRRNRERITQALRSDPHLDELVAHLQRWTDQTQRVDIDLGNAVLDCLPAEYVSDQTALAASTAWKICALQMAKANHCGDVDALRVWTSMAESWRPHIVQDVDCDRMLVLNDIQKLIGEKHNRYAFSDPIGRDGVTEEVRELEHVHDRQVARRGPCSNAVLGKYYGTLGQHYGFLGPDFLETSMAFLEKAIGCFCGDADWMRQEQDRDRLYQVFALSAAGRVDKAERILRTVRGLWRDDGWNIDVMNAYQLHALLRVHVDANRTMDSGLWSAIRDAWQRGEQGHPSQLIAYNLGLLASTRDGAVDLFNRAVGICLNAQPTIRIMALLPLAQLYALDPTLAGEAQVTASTQALRNGSLCPQHFHALLHAPSWEAALLYTAEHNAVLFPFTYR